MKQIMLLLLSLNFHLFALCQSLLVNKQVDSITQLLSQAIIDTVKYELHMQIGMATQFTNHDQAVQEFKTAMQIARNRNDTPRTMLSISTLSYSYLQAGENAKSIEMLQEMLQYAEKTGSDATYPLAIIGKNYEEQGDFENALIYSRKSFLTYENLLKKKKPVDPRGYSAGPFQMGSIFEKMHQFDSAFYYAKMGYQRITEKPLDPGMEFFYCQICNLLAKIYSQQQKPIDAFRFYQLAHKKAIQAYSLPSIIESEMGIAKYYQKSNQDDSAIHYATLAYENAIQLKRFDIMKESSLLKRAVYEKQRKYDLALLHNDLAIAARDSVTGAEKIREVASLTYKEEKRQEKIIQEIEVGKIAYRNKVKLYSLLGILVGLVLLASILYRNNQQKNRANMLLQEQKEEVHKAMTSLKSTQAQLIQSEKMASLGQLTSGIAHEIQNPLNFVNNFSEINIELIEELKLERKTSEKAGKVTDEDQIINDISQNLKKVILYGKRADAIVKGMLQHSRGSSGTSEKIDINALTEEYLRLSYHGFKNKENSLSDEQSGFNVSLKTDFDRHLDKVEIIPQDIGRVLLNLFNNSFYALSAFAKTAANSSGDSSAGTFSKDKKNVMADSSYEPIISVSTKKVNDNIEIKIRDNGGGIPDKVKEKIFQPFFTTKPSGEGTGLGLSLSYDIIKAHGGKIDFKTEEGKFTEFVIQLPAK